MKRDDDPSLAIALLVLALVAALAYGAAWITVR
jgi:hypothetical protein